MDLSNFNLNGTAITVCSDARESEEERIRRVYRKRLLTDRRKYSLRDPANLYFAHAMDRALGQLLAEYDHVDIESAKILEVGCGNGAWLRRFMLFGAQPANLTGIDLMPEAIAEARRLCSAEVQLLCGSATAMRFPSHQFDVVCQSMVLSSVIDSSERNLIASEMLRVLKPDGLIVSFDFLVKSPRNPDTIAIGRRGLERLFPRCSVHTHKIVLAPPLARVTAPHCLLLTHVLEAFSFLRTYYLTAIITNPVR